MKPHTTPLLIAAAAAVPVSSIGLPPRAAQGPEAPGPPAYVRYVTIAPGDPLETIVAKASRVVPSPNQLAWQRREFIAQFAAKAIDFAFFKIAIKAHEDSAAIVAPLRDDRRKRVRVNILGQVCKQLEATGNLNKDHFDGILEFLKVFVVKCQHGKEENYLFVKMNAYGFRRENGPVSAMLSEQGERREHLLALKSIGDGEGAPSPQEQDVIKGHALGYILRIRPHMAREENIAVPDRLAFIAAVRPRGTWQRLRGV